MTTKQIAMYAIQELHCDSWSGNELGNIFYFATKKQADDYKVKYCTKYNNKSHAPEYYKTFTTKGEVWVQEDLLTLQEDDCGMYCLLQKQRFNKDGTPC